MSRFDLTPEQITSQPLYRVVPILAFPLLLQNLVVILNRVVDLFWVGRLSGDAVAAIGLTIPISALANIAVVGIPYLGTQIVVSQRVGDDDTYRARRASFNGLALGATLGIVVAAVVIVAAPSILRLVTGLRPATEGGAARTLAVRYLRIAVLAQGIAVLVDVVEASLVARGDSRAALGLTLTTVVTNVLLDPVLMFGVGPIPGFGIRGAAAATVASQAAGLCLAAAFVARERRGGVLARNASDFSMKDLREIVGVGWPPTLQRANQYVADLLVTVVVFAAGGPAGVSAYIVGTQFFSVALVPGLGIQTATQSVVGQNLGDDNPDRAARAGVVGIAVLAAILIPLGMLQWLNAETIVRTLAPGLGGAAADDAATFLKIFAYSYPAVAVIYAIQGTFNGASRSRVSFYASVFQYWTVQVPIAVTAVWVLDAGLVGIFWSVAVAKVASAIALSLYYAWSRSTDVFRVAAGEVSESAGD